MPQENYFQHEALDRCSIIASILGTQLIDHPYIQSTKAIKAKLLKAEKLINEAYQQIGRSKVSNSRVSAVMERLAEKSHVSD